MKLPIPVRVMRTALIATLAALAACGSDSATGVAADSAKLRIVNSVFQYGDATSTPSTAAPIAIDVLIDSSTTAPGISAIPPVSLASFSGADASAYEPVSGVVHTFVARRAGDTGPTSSFYTNTNNVPYLPHQYLNAGTPYTLVVAGIVPAVPTTGGTNVLTPSTAVPISIITDDPFPPPLVNGTYQARFRVVNAAPFASPSGTGTPLSVYLTPGSTAPATLAGLTADATAYYRYASVYVNADAGAYTLTVAAGTTVIAQTSVTLAAGDVRTYVVQSTGYAAAPSPANHVIRSLLDNTY